jgi:predicted glycosyltransferase
MKTPALLFAAHPTYHIVLVYVTPEFCDFVAHEFDNGAVLQEVVAVGFAARAVPVGEEGVLFFEILGFEVGFAVACYAA